MFIQFLSFAIPIFSLLVIFQLTFSQATQPHIFTSEEIFLSLFSVVGFVYGLIQIVNPFELFKRFALGSHVPFPLFRWQLERQLRDLRKFYKANLIGDGRKFVKELYIERKEAEVEFSEFLLSAFRCFAVIGESGIGKTNLLLGLSEKVESAYPVLFYQGTDFRGGLQKRLAEDLPWAFRDSRSFLEAGRAIASTIHFVENDLLIFIDALDDVPPESRAALVEEIRLLAELGIRFVVSCKDVVWTSFVKSEGSDNFWSQMIYPSIGANQPGYKLERCSPDERNMAWSVYSKYFDIRGEISEELQEEIGLLYLLRLIGETFQGQSVPGDLNSRELFQVYWQKKQEKIGSALHCLVVVKAIASALVKFKKTEVSEIEVWPDGMPEHIQNAFDGLINEYVVLTRVEGYRKMLAFSHEKFQSFAICILLGEWDRRTEASHVKDLALELLSLSVNPIVINAFEFFVMAYDKGESSLCAELLERDIAATVRYFSQISGPYPLHAERKEISEPEKTGLIRKFAQLVRIMTILYGKYFPSLRSRFYNQNIGGFISIQNNGVARAFTYSAKPGEIVRDDSANLKDSSEWKSYKITGSLTTGHWQYFYESIPLIEAIKLLSDNLRDVLGQPHKLDREYLADFAELKVPPLVIERVWYFLFCCRINGYRNKSYGTQIGAFGLLRFANKREVLDSNLADLIYRVKYEIVWLYIQQKNLVELEKRPNGGTYTNPEDSIVDEKIVAEWVIAKDLSDSDFSTMYIGHSTPNTYKALLEALWCLESSGANLFPVLRQYNALREPFWSLANDDELKTFFEPIIAGFSVSYRSFVSASFPEIAKFFSADLIDECLAFWEFQTKEAETYIRVQLALMDKTALNIDEGIKSLLIINTKVLPEYGTYPVPLSIEFDGNTYSAFACVDGFEIWDFPLKELILGMLKDDLNAIFGRLQFWHRLW